MRARTLLLTGLLVFLVLVTLGPGLITRHGQRVDCSAEAVGCSDGAGKNPSDYHTDDGRVAGNPGDLIVLYCQRAERTISVYGIVHSAGVYLASFEADKLRAAGKLSVALDPGGMVSMMLTASNTYYVALKGGLVTAAGLDTYAKLFHCDF